MQFAENEQYVRVQAMLGEYIKTISTLDIVDMEFPFLNGFKNVLTEFYTPLLSIRQS